MQLPFIKIKHAPPSAPAFIHVAIKPEQAVVSRFLHALAHNPEDAKAFVSKIHSPRLNLHDLREVITTDSLKHTWVQKLEFHTQPKNIRTRSLYVEDPIRKVRRLLHLRMIYEPNQFGQWKVFVVDQEECAKIPRIKL